jgi:hypothetical protein
LPQLLLDIQLQLREIQTKQQLIDDRQSQIHCSPSPQKQVENLQKQVESDLAGMEQQDQGRDRRRLKERLKKASHRTFERTHHIDWIEYIFGICSGDQRMGTQGSR